MILAQLPFVSEEKIIIARGLPSAKEEISVTNKNVTIYNSPHFSELQELINNASLVISRSGYTTVMDMLWLQKKCIFIPTPGQTEQEYLAEYLSTKNYCLHFQQQNFNLKNAINLGKNKALTLNAYNIDEFKKYITPFLKN